MPQEQLSPCAVEPEVEPSLFAVHGKICCLIPAMASPSAADLPRPLLAVSASVGRSPCHPHKSPPKASYPPFPQPTHNPCSSPPQSQAPLRPPQRPPLPVPPPTHVPAIARPRAADLPRPLLAVSASVDRSVFSLAASRKVTTARAWSSVRHLATW
jgi:hypothetical protein